MAINYTNNGDGTSTIELSYTTDTQRVLDTLEDAARYYYAVGYGLQTDENGEPLTFDDLTNSQKLAVINDWCKSALITAAGTYHITTSVDAERESSKAEAEDKYLD